MHLRDLQAKIGKQIKKLRIYHEMTQEQVAEKLHIDRNAYGEIERGRTDIHLSRLVQIANFFDVEASELFGYQPKAAFYITGSSNTLSHTSQCNEYYGDSSIEIGLQHALEKAQLQIEHLQKELSSCQKIIALLEDRFFDEKTE